MINYASYSWRNGQVSSSPDTLATISMSDLAQKNYKCAGCVINSDRYQGNGKHWMALFADWRDNSKWTVEFFNSSGNSPAPEWINWLIKTKNQLENMAADKPIEVEVCNVVGRRQQYSKSECGPYSLFYIWARLNNIKSSYFLENEIPDKYMFEFRQHLFNDKEIGVINGVFDWERYKGAVQIEWESSRPSH
jgi:hypothetical protein